MFCFELEEPPCSTFAFFFFEEEESEDGAGRFSTAGVERARFLNSSRSLSKLGSIILLRGVGGKRQETDARVSKITESGGICL